MNTNELIDRLKIAEFNRIAAGRGGGSVWVEDDNGYRQIESVIDDDGGVYIKLASVPLTPGQRIDSIQRGTIDGIPTTVTRVVPVERPEMRKRGMAGGPA